MRSTRILATESSLKILPPQHPVKTSSRRGDSSMLWLHLRTLRVWTDPLDAQDKTLSAWPLQRWIPNLASKIFELQRYSVSPGARKLARTRWHHSRRVIFEQKAKNISGRLATAGNPYIRQPSSLSWLPTDHQYPTLHLHKQARLTVKWG